ncbi:MAG: NAD-dependent epimerase/dehydratase family protein [Candidatus Hodarchaeales archaeon]
MSYWKNRRVIVTGGSGFLGKHLVSMLKEQGAEVFVPRSKDYDLTVLANAIRCMEDFKPNIVFHGAAFYGGLGINIKYPGKIYYINLVMGANVMEAARIYGVDKFITIGTACSYPGYLTGELKESDIWAGPVHDSVAHYGLTKKMMEIQGRAYRKQYGLNSIHLILTNLYGPGDSYNPERSHVVAALIKKFVEAKLENKDVVEVWGTGKPIREFIHVKECAEAIIQAGEKYNDLEPLNIGTGIGTSIKELVENIVEITDYSGKLFWNIEKPDGQMKKILDISKLKNQIGWESKLSLKDGLKDTIDWYMDNKEEADKKW